MKELHIIVVSAYWYIKCCGTFTNQLVPVITYIITDIDV